MNHQAASLSAGVTSKPTRGKCTFTLPTEGVFVPDEAQHILDLLMRRANDIAVTLTQFPQYYEPLFLERDHKGRTASIVDEWCCGYVKGIALDPSGWQPYFEAHPDWFEAIHLYGTESGWDRLKELV